MIALNCWFEQREKCSNIDKLPFSMCIHIYTYIISFWWMMVLHNLPWQGQPLAVNWYTSTFFQFTHVHRSNMSFYELLDVDQDATLDEIRSAFKRRALAVHPDKGGRCDQLCLVLCCRIQKLWDRLETGGTIDISEISASYIGIMK